MRNSRLVGKTYDMVCIAIFAVIMAICSWISIPTVVPFTLQTFGLFLALAVLGGKKGTWAVCIYILLGFIGLPVFAGFTGGVGILLSNTGGYIFGFLFGGLVMCLVEKFLGNKTWSLVIGLVLTMITYFTFGTLWFMAVYTSQVGAVSLTAVLSWCVIPFVIPDFIKMVLAISLSKRIKNIINQE